MAIFYPQTLPAAFAPFVLFYIGIMAVCHYFSTSHKRLLFTEHMNTHTMITVEEPTNPIRQPTPKLTSCNTETQSQ